MSLSYNVYKSSLCLLSPATKNVIGLSSVTLPIMFKLCLQAVWNIKFNHMSAALWMLIDVTEANHVVTDGSLRKGCFVRLKSFQANSVKGKK